MRWRPLRWLLWLPVPAVAAAGVLFYMRGPVEDDLRFRARQALSEAGFDWASVDFVGRDARLTGKANTEQEQQSTLDGVKSTWGVRVVNDESALIEALKPYLWSLNRDGKTVVIDGYADNDASRKAVTAAGATEFRGLTVRQGLKLARGMPPQDQWLGAVSFASKLMSGVAKGEAKLEDLALTISGEASSPQSYADIEKKLHGALPAGVSLAKDALIPPTMKPYGWAADWKDGALTLSGYAPDEAFRKKLLAAAQFVAPQGAKIVDQMLVAGGPPDNIGAAAEKSLGSLVTLQSGTVRLTDANAELRGVAVEQAAAEAASKSFGANLPSNFKATENVTFLNASIPEISPYAWSADLSGSSLELRGYAPDKQTVDALTAFAGKRFASARVVNHMALGKGAPEGFSGAAMALLDSLSQLSKGKAAIAGKSTALLGEAADQATADSAKSGLAAALPQGFSPAAAVSVAQLVAALPSTGNSTATLPTITPYTWAAQEADKTLTLSGYAPSEAVRKQLAAFAAGHFHGVKVIDKTQLGGGAPDGFSTAALISLEQLSGMDSGGVTLTDQALSFIARAVDQTRKESATSVLQADLPRGFAPAIDISFEKAKVSLIVAPYTWAAQFWNKSLTLTGYMPDESARKEIADYAAMHFKGVKVIDKTQIAGGAPDQLAAALKASLDHLAHMDYGGVALSDRSLQFTAHASDETRKSATEGELKSALPGGYEPSIQIAIDKAKEASAPAKPAPTGNYEWDALLDGGALAVSGGAPSLSERDMVLRIAQERLPGVKIADQMAHAGNLPSGEDDWQATVDAAFKALADLGAGRAHIKGSTLTLTGATTDAAMPDYIAESLKRGVGKGYASAAVIDYKPLPVPPAYETWLKYDGLKVSIEGAVPDQPSRTNLLARLKALFPGRDFDDRTSLRAGAPDGWFAALLQGLQPLSNLSAGQLRVTGKTVALSGLAEDQKIIDDAHRRINLGLPKGYNGDDQINYVAPPPPDAKLVAKRLDDAKYDIPKLMRQASLSPPECQALLNSLMKGKAFFASGSYALDGRAAAALTPLVAVAKRCPESQIVISGHTDSDGAPAFNQQLSERRAEAVVKFLSARGIEASRLKSIGYGQNEPIAPNDTPFNKAQNRRIEFDVAPST